MEKVFLSHSSADKSYVEYIANQFGKNQCVYDKMCFESGMKNLDEIFKGVDDSSIFVVFISDAALNSKWVKQELSIAEERLNHDQSKLSQIFPIIIDESITHKDSRIPEFMRVGFGSYNLRVIKRREIAYRKIRAQLTRRLLQKSLLFQNKYDIFYGRDKEIAQFKSSFDSGDNIKCIVASGIEGVGRKTYIIAALKNAKIIERYYDPVIISLSDLDGIDDLIVKLYEVGFGQCSLNTIASLTSISQKINALSEALCDIQSHMEHVIIYDDACLIKNDGELRYWFMQAITQIRNEVTISISSRYHINNSFMRSHKEIFHISLLPMTYPEWNGLLRIYSKSIGIEFDSEDRSYFKDIISGYPPQVIFCADLAKDNSSIDYVKNNPEKVVAFGSASATRILEATIPVKLLDVSYEFLAFLSVYGSVPFELVQEVFSLNSKYEDVYRILKSSTICRQEGLGGEYVVINTVVGDYIQRSRFDLPESIANLLKEKLEDFNNNLSDPTFMEKEDFESVRFYLKENLKSGKTIPEKYMYSTLYLKTIYELYNRQKYVQVVDITKNLKESGAFIRFDLPIRDRIQGYYCRALARQRIESFYDEVEYFNRPFVHTNQDKDYIEYQFLRGFMCRNEGRYNKALERYKNVLTKNPKHQGAMREIVIVYKGMEDYESAFIYAQLNYEREPDNPFQIQPYFEALLRRASRNERETENITRMRDTLRRLNDRKPISIYYELMAQYALYIEKDELQVRALLSEGNAKFKDSSFIARTAFNCYEYFHDIENMEKSLQILRQEAKNNKSIEPAVAIRQVILDAYRGKSNLIIQSEIDKISGITEDSKNWLKKRVNSIIS